LVSTTLLEALIEKLEKSFLEFCDDGIFDDHRCLGVVVNEGDFWPVDELGNVVRKKICAVGNHPDRPFKFGGFSCERAFVGNNIAL